MSKSTDAASSAVSSKKSLVVKFAVLAAFVATAGGVYFAFGDQLSLAALAEQEEWLRSTAREKPIVALAAAFAIYVVVTGLSLPGAAAMTLIIGWLFGFLTGTLLVSFASTLGATLAFLVARFALRDTLRQKFGERLTTFEHNLEKDGPFYLFTLRLIVGVPFWMVNLLMGLTPIKTRTFWWVSQFGMLPGTMAYVYAGSTINLQALAKDGVTGLVSKELLIAFTVLGLLPITIKKLIERFRPKAAERATQTTS